MDDALDAWLATSIAQYALAYIKTSYVIPLHGIESGICTCGNKECGSPGKHPFTRHGLKDASNKIEEVAKLFNYRSDLNIGIITGQISDFFVLDVDGGKNGFESLDKLFSTYGEFDPTIICQTGNGVHIWFAYPKNAKIGNRTNFLPGLDIRGENGYVVAPPSMHITGKTYQLTETSAQETCAAPQWLIDMIQTTKGKAVEHVENNDSSGAIPHWSVEELQRMLDCLNPSMGYADWIRVGMGIHDGGYSYQIWNDWSSRGSNYQNNCCAPHWKSFKTNGGISMGTLVEMAKLHGWKPQPKDRPPIDTSTVENLVKKAQNSLKPQKNRIDPALILGFNAMDLPGLIGDTVRWITKHASRKQPELALLNTIAFAGSVFGRRYASPRNTRTNIYMVGIADTGAGKDHSRKALKDLAHAAGLDERIGADSIRSDSGLLRSLMNNSSQIMMIDEFGHFLQAISNEKAPHYVRSQIDVLLKLYSHSNSVYNHGDYADAKSKNIIIECPNLCIYGTSTEEKYVKSLRKSAIESGELNRFIAIRARGDKEYPDRQMPDYEIEEDLVGRWKQFSPRFGSSIGEIINNAEIAPEPIKIKWGKCDDLQYKIECRQIDKVSDSSPLRHLWGRLFENTVKIAMIMAIARNPKAPEFEQSDFDLGQLIVESSIEYLSILANNHMSETPQEDSNNEIVKAIKEAGGRMGRRDIMRKFRKLKKRELDEIIGGLLEQEVLDVEKESDGGRPKTVYRLLAA